MITQNKKFAVVEGAKLEWPGELVIPAKGFRLLVAADTSELPVDYLSDFARTALEQGMVYFCSWGPGCERFHDIVDEVVVEGDLGERKYAGSEPDDVIMTTWHYKVPLEEALDYLVNFAGPADGFQPNSDFLLVICMDSFAWEAVANRFLQSHFSA